MTMLIPDDLIDKPVRTIAAALNISHETARRLRYRLKGMCQSCGKTTPVDGATRCLPCLKKMRRVNRKADGYKAWRPGGVGRPPVEATNQVDNHITNGDI